MLLIAPVPLFPEFSIVQPSQICKIKELLLVLLHSGFVKSVFFLQKHQLSYVF